MAFIILDFSELCQFVIRKKGDNKLLAEIKKKGNLDQKSNVSFIRKSSYFVIRHNEIIYKVVPSINYLFSFKRFNRTELVYQDNYLVKRLW